MINYSPSEFAFGFEACNSCYYDKKINVTIQEIEKKILTLKQIIDSN
mgnify:CR=1 FL=1